MQNIDWLGFSLPLIRIILKKNKKMDRGLSMAGLFPNNLPHHYALPNHDWRFQSSSPDHSTQDKLTKEAFPIKKTIEPQG